MISKHFALACYIVTTILLMLGTGMSSSEVTLDGTLGPKGNLSGPNYQIPADVGRRVGSNLFHSFGLFNVNTGESATFSGSGSIDNILARVTGGAPSNIDGLLRSTIPTANLFLLNPAGIMFGPNASLDVQGAFHASTADYLRLSDGIPFTVIPSSDDVLLTTAPVEAFGFLGENSAAISIDQSVLEVPTGKTLSLIAGNVSVEGVPREKNGKPVNPGDPEFDCGISCLRSKGGKLQIASVSQEAEVPVDLSRFNRTSAGFEGQIKIGKHVLLDVSDKQAGNIVIRAGRFIVDSAELRANSHGERDVDSNVMDLTASENVKLSDTVLTSVSEDRGARGSLLIEAKQVELANGTQIRSGPPRSEGGSMQGGGGGQGENGNESNQGGGGGQGGNGDESNQGGGQNDGNDSKEVNGSGGDIVVRADQYITLRQETEISANTTSARDAGNVQLDAQNIQILDGSRIGSSTDSSGNSGNVSIRASERLLMAGTNGNTDPARNRSSRIAAASRFGASGNSGSIELSAPTVLLANGARITSSTSGVGDGGVITISASQDLTLTGARLDGEGSSIKASSEVDPGEGGGTNAPRIDNAGPIFINTSSLTLEPGTEIASNTSLPGQGGPIHIQVDNLRMDSATIQATSMDQGSGNAGNISVTAINNVSLTQDSSISTFAEQADGGNIELTVANTVNISDSKITATVAGDVGNGGNITIDPIFVILDSSEITANAFGGDGGNILIVADQFIKSPDSIVRASSNFGVDGAVEIDSPDTNITSGLETLPTAFFDRTNLLSTPCTQRSGANVSQLVVRRYEVLPNSPYAFAVQLPQSITVQSDTDSNRLSPVPRVGPLDSSKKIEKQANTIASSTSTSAPIDEHLLSAASFYRMGQVRNGLVALEDARILAERSDDRARLALAVGGISDGYLLTRDLDNAERYAKRSLSISRQSKNPGVLASALNYYGNVLVAKQDYSKALTAYHEGIALAEQTSDALLAAVMTMNQLRAVSETRQTETAKAQISAAIDQIQALPISIDKGYGLIALGDLALQLITKMPANRSDFAQVAHTLFTNAQTVAETLNDARSKSYVFGHLGELYAMQGFYEEAEQFFRRALFFVEESGNYEVSARWYWKLGELFYQKGRRSESKKAYRNAIDKFESIESALLFGRRGQPQLFRETIGNVYRQLAKIMLEETDVENQPAERESVLRSVQTVMERFKVAELRNHFQDECLDAQLERAQPKSIDAQLNPHTATLYPIIFSNHLSLLLSFDDGSMQSVRVPVNAVELKQALIDFRKLLNRKGDIRKLRKNGIALYEWLIEPIEPFLEQQSIDTLIVVPDGALSTIPFAALYDGQEFLASRYAFALSPGLTMTDIQARKPEAHQILLAGLTKSVQGYSDLPYVSDEMETVASLYKSKLLLNEAFQKDTIQTELKRTPYSVIDFATHAQIDSDPKKSFLLTYDDKISFDELESFIRIGQFREQPVDLLVLSACSTAEGDERAALGLAGVALKAGARSAIGSLWNVNDTSTAKLIPAVFEHLKSPGVTKAQALQRAQQQLLTTPQYEHPYYWASFVLIGSWL